MSNKKGIVPIDWNFVIETIKQEKCILFLGPDVFSLQFDEGLESRINTALNIESNPDIKSFYQEDSLFLFDSRAKKTKTYYRLKQFYSSPFEKLTKLFEKVAQIPIHLIVNLSPDHTLPETMDELGYANSFSYYWKNTSATPVFFKPRIDKPSIYNMLGSITQQESMVLTHTDLFEYLESVFSGAHFPDQLKKQIKEAHNFIFLGVPFQRWYMQLLLRILYIHNDFDFVRYASSQMIDSKLQTFCSDQFNIEFVPNNIENFIDTLLKKCEEAELINEPKDEKNSPLAAAKKDISQDKIEDCFSLLLGFTQSIESKDYQEDVILLLSKFNRLKKRIIRGIITAEEANVGQNKINKALLGLITELEALNY